MAAWSKEVFARNLRFYMDQTGKSQKEIAEIAGVSAPSVNDWLQCKKFPRIDRVEKLALYFGVLKSDLIEDIPPDTKKQLAIADELSATKQELLNFVSGLSESEAAILLASLKSMLGKP